LDSWASSTLATLAMAAFINSGSWPQSTPGPSPQTPPLAYPPSSLSRACARSPCQLRLLCPDYQHEWDFLHCVLADFRVHLFIAGVDFNADPLTSSRWAVAYRRLVSSQHCRHFICILHMPLRDWD